MTDATTPTIPTRRRWDARQWFILLVGIGILITCAAEAYRTIVPQDCLKWAQESLSAETAKTRYEICRRDRESQIRKDE